MVGDPLLIYVTNDQQQTVQFGFKAGKAKQLSMRVDVTFCDKSLCLLETVCCRNQLLCRFRCVRRGQDATLERGFLHLLSSPSRQQNNHKLTQNPSKEGLEVIGTSDDTVCFCFWRSVISGRLHRYNERATALQLTFIYM